MSRWLGRLSIALFVGATGFSGAAESEWVYRGATGRLIYAPDAQGDRVMDFSAVGYQGGKSPLPTVPTVVSVLPLSGDDTARIQAAITQVSNLPLGPDGFRGAVELGAGEFQIASQLQINASGVVLRGAGRETGGTLLRGTGTGQRDLIQIAGAGSESTTGSTRNLIDKVVPVGARSFRVNTTSGFSVGDTVRIERPSTANWISDLGMDMIPPRTDGGTTTQWQPGSFNIRYSRVITRIEGDRVFIDAPLANSFDQQYGGGTIKRTTWDDGIQNIGVENLRAESDFTSPTDEDHAWNFVSINNAQNVWVRDTASAHFGRSAVLADRFSKWVTVDNVRNETPKSLITGSRRYTFDLSGQLGLVTNSEANEGRHDFVNNSSRPAGPNVFHNSVANDALDEAGPHQRWATGTLFDNITVDGDQINARNRGNFGSGHGWAGANMVIWNSTAESYIVQNPPTAQNWLVGSVGTVIDDDRFGQQEPGYIDSHGTRVDVESLYEAQVEDASRVTTFHWDGTAGDWTNPDAWNQRLTPGEYRVESRDYLVGDIDDFTDDGSGSVDEAPIDPAWEAAIQANSALPITGFDDASGNKNVAFTIQHQLDPGERVVHGSLALSLKQSGGVIDSDFLRLFDTSPNNKLTFTELGWDTQIGPSEAFVGVVDLGNSTDQLQSGSVNVQVNDDTAVDWALYTVTVAKSTGTPGTAEVVIADGESLINGDVGSVSTLGLEGGVLSLASDGIVEVLQDFEQEAAGGLRIAIDTANNGGLIVGGNALLAGDLELVLDDGYAPAFGDEITFLNADGVLSGEFANATLPSLNGGLRWRLTRDANSVGAEVILAGDYNADGTVDAADYSVWRDAANATQDLVADGNGDGTVDAADRQVWIDHFGLTATASSSAAVPEPATALLFASALFLAVFRRL